MLLDIFKARKIEVPPRPTVERFNSSPLAHWGSNKPVERYTTVEDIYAVVRFLATTASGVPIYAYADEKQLDEKINEILAHPDITMGGYEFYENLYTNIWLHGEGFIIREQIELGPNRGKVSLRTVSPLLMVVNANRGTITGYKETYNGQTVREYEPGEVMFIKNVNPDPYSVRGLSPLTPLVKSETLNDAQKNLLTAQTQNGGIDTIVYDERVYDDGPIVNDSRKEGFMRFITNPSNKGVPYFASGKMAAINIGSQIVDMNLIEAMKIPFKKICNVYGTSDILFNSDSASTESNVKEMTKRTYTNTVLPTIRKVCSALERGLGLSGKVNIRPDLSEITELQEDMNQLISSLNIAWWLTPNQRLEAMNYDRRNEPEFDQPFIPQGLIPLEDYSLPPILNPQIDEQE